MFAEHGFEAARLDDVAARAGVAKGTLYLYFDSKEALFEALIRNAVSPIMEQVAMAAAAPDASPAKVIETFFALFEKQVLGTNRKLLLRLILAEGPRFPAIAEFYYREVVSRGLALMRGVAERAVRQGEFATDAPVRYPQLIVAPLLVAVLWDGLFADIDPLNVGGLLRAHREVLAGKPRKGSVMKPVVTAARTRILALSAVAAIGLAVAAFAYWREETARLEFQGWVEAYFIFVSPDEAGRVETLSVREGDTVTVGAPLFALDADLQRAAVAENEAAVTNARITFERAQELLKKAVGSQKVFDDAESALRTAEARLNSARTRLDRRRVVSPVAGTVQEVYFRVGEMVQAGRPIVSLLPPDNTRVRFFVPQATLPKVHIGDPIAVTLRRLRRRPRGARELHLGAGRVHAARHLQPGGALAARVPRRGHARNAPRSCASGQPVTVVLQPAAGVSHARK